MHFNEEQSDEDCRLDFQEDKMCLRVQCIPDICEMPRQLVSTTLV